MAGVPPFVPRVSAGDGAERRESGRPACGCGGAVEKVVGNSQDGDGGERGGEQQKKKVESWGTFGSS